MKLPRRLRLHARQRRPRRGRAHAPAGRAPGHPARHPGLRRSPAGRRQRDGRGLEDRAASRTSPSALMLTRQNAADARPRGVRAGERRRARRLRPGRRRGRRPARAYPHRQRQRGAARARGARAAGGRRRALARRQHGVARGSSSARTRPTATSVLPAAVPPPAGRRGRRQPWLAALGRRRRRDHRPRPLRRLGAGRDDLRAVRLHGRQRVRADEGSAVQVCRGRHHRLSLTRTTACVRGAGAPSGAPPLSLHPFWTTNFPAFWTCGQAPTRIRPGHDRSQGLLRRGMDRRTRWATLALPRTVEPVGRHSLFLEPSNQLGDTRSSSPHSCGRRSVLPEGG